MHEGVRGDWGAKGARDMSTQESIDRLDFLRQLVIYFVRLELETGGISQDSSIGIAYRDLVDELRRQNDEKVNNIIEISQTKR